MPAKLSTGQEARTSPATSPPWRPSRAQDTGALGQAVQQAQQKAVKEQNGTLQIDADPTGQLKFLASSATATPGRSRSRCRTSPRSRTTSRSRAAASARSARSSQNGGTSTVTATLKPGTYTFYCSVDGHEAAGMKGTLTVK